MSGQAMVAEWPDPAPAAGPVGGPFTFRPHKRPTPFIGDMAIRVEGAELIITGHVVGRAEVQRTRRVLRGTVVGGLVAYLAMVVALVTLDQQSADEGSDPTFGAAAIVGLLVWILAMIAVGVWIPTHQHRRATTTTVRASAELVRRGRRVLELRFAEPLVAGDRDPFPAMRIKGHRRTDAEGLVAALRRSGPSPT